MSATRKFTIIALYLILASAVPSFGQNYTLSGTVRELERTTGAPLQEVRVDVDSSKFIAFTKADGTYSISGIPSGTHNIRISKPGFIGVFKKDYTLDSNKTFNVSLADTIQESPQGTQVLKLSDYEMLHVTPGDTDMPPWSNGSTWNGVTEGNLIPVYLANATSADSIAFRNAIGACNGNWQNSPDGSVEKGQKRALYLLSTDPQTGLVKKGIYVDMNGSYTRTTIFSYEPNSSYISKVKVELTANLGKIIQKELFGRSFAKGNVSGRLSYMNATGVEVTDLDHMLNIVFFNHWAAIPRGEQNATMVNMENTPIFVIPTATNIIKPLDNASNLEQNVQIQYNNKFGADRYRLQASDREDFSNILKDLEVHRIDTVLFFDKGKEYFLRVRPENVKGNPPWSNIVSFTTKGNTAPSTFTILTPINNQTIVYTNKKLEISSSAATDVDGDPLNKTYHVTGPDLDTLIFRNNTEKAYIDSARLKLDSEFQILAEVSDGMLTTQASNNPVKFRTPKSAVGIEETLSKNLKVYPVPVRGVLHIEDEPGIKGLIRIFSSDGVLRDIVEITGTSERIDMSGYAPGLYILQLPGGTRERSILVVKE